MEEIILYIFGGAFALAIGFGLTIVFIKDKNVFDFEKKSKEAGEMLISSEKEALRITETTKSNEEIAKENLREELNRRNSRISKIKEALKQKEHFFEKREERNRELKLKIATLEEETQGKENEIKRTEKEFGERLGQKTGISLEEAQKRILEKYRKELEIENKERIVKIEEDLKENANKTAKRILVNVMQRLCSPTSVETKAVLIKVPKDHIKGKIVGKAGQNIEHFEKIMDVDVIFNDLPNTVSISAFNLVNRRIAQRAMEFLIKTKDEISKQTVEKAILNAKEEVEKELLQIGQKVVDKLGIKNLDKELIKTIGRLQFRTSYGQNIMKHSMEVAWVATMLGGELGLDLKTCKIAGFLHDLGKAIDQNPDVQGAHDFLTKELMEKYGFSEAEVHAAWTHHDSEAQQTPEALIVKAADAVSAGRPGARQESLEKYLERIRALEATAKSFEGVRYTYAISAGREVRVMVDSEKIADKDMKTLAKNVASKIEADLSYPGKIKVNIIRRTDQIELAK